MSYNYSDKFYDDSGDSAMRSARIVVPIVDDILCLDNKSVVDLGCGIGAWLSVFSEYGYSIHGYDFMNPKKLIIPSEVYSVQDLTKPIDSDAKYSLAISLEVAEHLYEQYADVFIDSLTNLSDIVLFSAAIPGQVGTNHVNGQWPTYWIKKFEKRNYQVVDCVRPYIWNNRHVSIWYSQNMFLFYNRDKYSGPLKELVQYNRPNMYNLISYRWKKYTRDEGKCENK